MAQIETKISEKLSEASEELSKTSMKCGICHKKKKILYICNFDNCDQADRLLCKNCGIFTHSHVDNDDDDDDDDNEGDDTDSKNQDSDKEFHSFDVNASYIIKYDVKSLSLQLSVAHKDKIKQTARDMNIMISTAKENETSTQRTTFELIGVNGYQAIKLSEQVTNMTMNMKYWKPWGEKMLTLLKNKELKNFTSEIATAGFGIGDRFFEYTKMTKEGAFTAAALTFVCEAGYHTYRYYWCNDMTGQQYKEKLITAASVSVGSTVGNIGGAAVGAAIGTYILPFIGTAMGGALGSFFGGIYVGLQAKKTTEEMLGFNNDKQGQIEKYILLKEALAHFGFEEDDIFNKNIFNADTIGKKYKQLAKEKHPDTPHGSEKKFLLLVSRMTMLLAIVEKSEKDLKATAKQFSPTMKMIDAPN